MQPPSLALPCQRGCGCTFSRGYNRVLGSRVGKPTKRVESE
jgi:hypothetical protein